ncbi:glutathione peroxidase [Ancylostoma caninum]|uniref:Glutathione peroxidase n=1 Tax=Ancylostoma caninum TaxID=29170 RepID=A0A368FK71_ANCCA|nr:glutathione peroxidase [Ancylostoma caninum]
MLLWLVFCIVSAAIANDSNDDDAMSAHRTIYDFTVKDIDGKEVSLSKYKGKVVIVVNVASYCGFTNNHYTELKTLQEKYYDQGLRVAAFPCNQFGAQQELYAEQKVQKSKMAKFQLFSSRFGR